MLDLSASDTLFWNLYVLFSLDVSFSRFSRSPCSLVCQIYCWTRIVLHFFSSRNFLSVSSPVLWHPWFLEAPTCLAPFIRELGRCWHSGGVSVLGKPQLCVGGRGSSALLEGATPILQPLCPLLTCREILLIRQRNQGRQTGTSARPGTLLNRKRYVKWIRGNVVK